MVLHLQQITVTVKLLAVSCTRFGRELKRHRACLQAGMTVHTKIVRMKPSGRMQSLNMMGVLDWQDMCSQGTTWCWQWPVACLSAMAVANCRAAPGHKIACSEQSNVSAAAAEQERRCKAEKKSNCKTAVRPVFAACLHRVAGDTGPGMPCCLLILIWVISLRYCSAGSLCIEAPAMVGALQSAICLCPTFRQRDQPAIHSSSKFLSIRTTTF